MRFGFTIFGLLAALILTPPALAQGTETDPDAILRAWMSSPHANSESESFRHWDSEGEIPGQCAVCHATPGLSAYLSGEQTPVNVIDHAIATGTTVECAACHDPAVSALSEVLFPSGARIAIDDGTAVCAICHQGRASGATVAAATQDLDDDTVSEGLNFINAHYATAAATRFGTQASGAFEYPGQTYAGRFEHVPQLASCTSCHGPHDTSVQLERCTTCHQGVSDLRAIRMSPLDVLGTGDTGAGIATVIDALRARLLAGIQTYAAQIGVTPIVYSDHAYPYFFADSDGDGQAGPSEAIFPNRYRAWTPRLLRAAYNYQFVTKDPGAYAHNPRYAQQVLIDSLADLAQVAPIDLAGLTRP